MIEAEQIALTGVGALTVLVLLRVVYQLASLTLRVAGYTAVVAVAAGIIEPSLIEPFLDGLTQIHTAVPLLTYETGSAGEKVVRIELFWEYVEAWQSFGYHLVLGAAGVLAVYMTMEKWYPGAYMVGMLWLWGVIELDQYLLEHQLNWQPWMDIYPEVVYAGAAGFGVGLMLAVAFWEPSLRQRRRSANVDIEEFL